MELVNSLEKEKSADGALELVWRGSDPVAFSRVISALQAAGIPHHSKSTHDHLVFGLGIPRPRYEVRVLQSGDGEGPRYAHWGDLALRDREKLAVASKPIGDSTRCRWRPAHTITREMGPAARYS